MLPLFLVRVTERITLTVFVLVVSVAVMRAFWRTLQRIDFKVGHQDITVGGSALLASPIFVLILLVCFSWVVLGNPIEFSTRSSTGEVRTVHAITARGIGNSADAISDEQISLLLSELNCHVSDVSRPLIKELKARFILAHWQPYFGASQSDFYNWAVNDADVAPSGVASGMFNARAPSC